VSSPTNTNVVSKQGLEQVVIIVRLTYYFSENNKNINKRKNVKKERYKKWKQKNKVESKK
jgi:ribosomal protein S8